jgi:hypothetical protein
MTIASDQTLSDRWADWLAATAPRRLAPATISEYRRQLGFFVEWIGSTLDMNVSDTSLRTAENPPRSGENQAAPVRRAYCRSRR